MAIRETDLIAPQLFGEINKSLGNSLRILDSKDSVIGREEELKQLRVVTNKKERPVACAVGGQGAGKSALVSAYKNELEEQGIRTEVFQLKVGEMADDPDQLKARMNTLLEQMKRYKDEALKKDANAEIILFIDEVHMVISIFGEGSKIGGDLLKESLARAEEFINVITATTFDEYQSYIVHDKALSRRLNKITINETSPPLTFNILKDWLYKQSIDENNKERIDYTKWVSDDILKQIIHANRAYQENEYEPAKSIDVLSSVISDSEVYKEPITKETLARVFRIQYNIDIGFSVDPDKVMEVFKSRIKGQPFATEEYRKMIEQIAFQLYPDSNAPRGVMLAIGTTGSGKTEACKALAYALFGDDKAFVNISMTDYADEDGDIRIRKKIGEDVSRNPFTIVLLDEVEKASQRVINVLLPILDEGTVVYHSKGRDNTVAEHRVSLKNTIIIATSNAGVKVMEKIQQADDMKYVGEELTEEMEISVQNMMSDVRIGLENVMKPEFLARFKSIIPFRTLDDDTLLEIADLQLSNTLGRIYDVKGIYVDRPPAQEWIYSDTKMKIDEISMYVVKERMGDETNTGQKGAREIQNVLADILNKIIRASRRNPHCKKFKLTTNGKCRFANRDTVEMRGLIRVEPVDEFRSA